MTTARQKAITSLEAAATVLLAPGWHAKHAAAQGIDGVDVGIWDDQACRFCAVGAIHAANSELSSRQTRLTLITGIALNALCTVLGVRHDRPVQNIAEFNDAATTTPIMVAEAMLQAADNLRNHNHDNRKC